MTGSKEQFGDMREAEMNEAQVEQNQKAQDPINVGVVEESRMNKQEMQRLADNILEQVKDGNETALSKYIKVDFLIKTLTKAKDGLKEEALDSADKFSSGGESMLGVEIKTRETGVKYDYSANQSWVQAKANLDKIQEQMKLATKTPGVEVIDKETGEVILPAIKTSTTAINLTYSK